MEGSRRRQPSRQAPPSAIAKRPAAPGLGALISKPASTELEVVQRFNAIAESKLVNLVTPVTAISKIPDWTAVSFAKVDVNPTPEEGDVYVDKRFCSGNEVALTKNAILRLMQAAGIQKVRSYQADNLGDPFYCQWTVLLQWRDFSGRWLPKEISKTIDLRDGAPATQKPEWACQPHGKSDCSQCGRGQFRKTGRNVPLDDSALAQARLHLHAQAETKALLRGVREFLSLKQKYTRAELQRPFVVPTLVPDLPMDDPQVKAAVLERELGLQGQIYGDDRRRGIAAAIVGHDDRTRGVSRVNPVELAEGTLDPGEPIERIDADVTPAPGDDRVVDAEPLDDGPLGPEPPPIGDEDQPDERPAEGVGASPPSAGNAAATTRPAEASPDEMPPPLEDERPEGACTCPCGCAEVPSPGLAKKAQANLGTVRCKTCYPDLGFDQKQHKGIRNLEIPKAPNATPEQVEAWNIKRRRSQKGGAR